MSALYTAKACGPDFSGYYFTWLMEQYPFENPYFKFQLDVDNKFYSKSWVWRENETQPVLPSTYNIDLWRKHLHIPLSISDSVIEQYIYADTTTAAHHPFARFLLAQKNGSLYMQYFDWLHVYTQTMMPPNDIWDYSNYTKFVALPQIQLFISQGKTLFEKQPPSFLQWRILYVMLRAAHFNKHYALCNQLFETYYPILIKDKFTEQYWCEGMYAGSQLRVGNQSSAMYYAARAYMHAPDQQEAALHTYLFTNRQWQSALPLCKQKSDSIGVLFLEAANHPYPNMDFIKQVYALQPQSDILKLLWLRETQKLEDYVFVKTTDDNAPKFYFNTDAAINMDSIYTHRNIIKEYIQLGEEILHAPKFYPMQVTVGNCLAFYYYNTKNYQAAAASLAAIKQLPKNEFELTQYKLLSALTHQQISQQFDAMAFQDVVSSLQKFPNTSLNNHIGYYVMYNEIAPYFLQAKDSVTAFWVYTAANCFDTDSFEIYQSDYSPESFNNYNYATYLLLHAFSIAQVKQLQDQYQQQKSIHPMANYCLQQTHLKNGAAMFTEVIAKKYMLQENWQAALALLPNLPTSYVQQMGPNPANFKINDTLEQTNGIKNNFSIQQILTLANNLQQQAQQTGQAKDKLLYGILLYNLSFYGRNHYVLDNHWYHAGWRNTAYFKSDSVDAHVFISGKDYQQQPMHPSFQNYFYLQQAEHYLSQALPLLSNREEQALCNFVLAKCWQKRCPTHWVTTDYGYTSNEADYVAYSITNPYFKSFKQYADTRMHDAVFNACSYYRMFSERK